MPVVNDSRFTDAANKAAELQRAFEARQWELMRLALAMGLPPNGLASPQGMPRIELFPVAPQPR
jgi:hypothetical protein